MKKNLLRKSIACLLVLSLTGCGTRIPTESGGTQGSNDCSDSSASDLSTNILPTPETKEESDAEENRNDSEKDEKQYREQLNSFSMMYYLAITAEEIRTSRDNRLALEDIYSALLNDVNPGAVDEITQSHLQNLRDIIKSYLNISTKRERLQFIYNQEKASAIRSAVPNPLAALSVSNAMNWKKLATAVSYTAIDSYNSYRKASEGADISFIMSGWELDDEEKETIMKNRDRAFDYMVDMVQEYGLDGMKTLNEKSVEKFAEICAAENPAERISLLEAEKSKYSLLGNYWLELSDCYFEMDQYTKCLECVEEYNKISTGIYRQDFNYLRILPKAIAAAQQIDTGGEYVSVIAEYADAIIANTSIDDWSARYFTAQVYMDLYSRTNDRSYLDNAYKIAKENVTVLLKNQRDINSVYLNDVIEQTITKPDYRYLSDEEKSKQKKEYKNERKRINAYNKELKDSRKTELLSLYEPLIVNCELLFSLAKQMDISDEEKAEIEAILRTNTNSVFLIEPINSAYSFTHKEKICNIEMKKDEIIIPADFLTAGAEVTVTAKKGAEVQIFDDCVVEKVKRKGNDIDMFDVYIHSEKMEKYEWTEESKVIIKIVYGDAYSKTEKFRFIVSDFEEHWYGDKVAFAAQ